MKIKARFLVLNLVIIFQVFSFNSLACSMCKVTIHGKTYLGNNEDSWRIGSKIWFENKTTGQFGAVYVGYGDNFPQGGMNEAGLAFDGLTIYPKKVQIDPAKKTASTPGEFIKGIMQSCITVEDVRNYAINFNRPFNGAVVFFADKFGRYLVMEPDTMIIGNDSKYIIANFCPSITTHIDRLNFERYGRGNDFLLGHRNDTSSDFCLALVDTMHECRNKTGDGTMYSFVADLEEGNFCLYFYHDFKHSKLFNLSAELKKGDHSFEMLNIFPPNAEYKKLVDYKTPQNNGAIRLFLIGAECLFSFSSLYFFISFFWDRKSVSRVNYNFLKTKILLIILSVVLLYYANALLNNQAIFYFPAPYHDWKFSMLNIAAYIPFLVLILIIPLIIRNIKIFKEAGWTVFSKYLFAVNNLTYIALIILFAYWKLYNIF